MRISDWSSDVCSSDLGESASDLRVRIARPTGECRAGASGIGRSFASLVLKRSNCLAHIERLRGSGRARRYARMRCDREAILPRDNGINRSAEHTSELQSLMRHSYAVFCWKQTSTLQIQHSFKRLRRALQHTTFYSHKKHINNT